MRGKEARLSTLTRADLEEIWLYIARDNVAAADRFIDRILQTCRKLAHTPRIGRTREDLARGLRAFAFERYIIFYRISKSGIEIARVLSGYRDLESLFGM